MILSIHQPSYFPWLGLLDKIAKTDSFVLLDDNQVVKGTYQYRNIFFCNGKAKYLTLPINYTLGIGFNKLEFKNDNWPDKHLETLRNYYLKAPHFNEVFDDLKSLFANFKHSSPIEVLKSSMQFCFEKLDIRVEFHLGSKIPYTGKKADMVLEICKHLEADRYLAGSGSYDYMHSELNKFEASGLEVIWHKFSHPVYPQHPKFEFVEGLSALDIFFFEGYKQASKIFWSNLYNHDA